MSVRHINDHSDRQKLINKVLGKRISRDRVISEIGKDPVSAALFNSFSEKDREKIMAFLAGEETLQILSDRFFKKILDP